MKPVALVTLLFCVANVFAQTNHYTSTKVFNEGEYSYQCDVSSVGNVTLYNSLNDWIGEEQKNKATGQTFVLEDTYMDVDLVTNESWL